MNYLDDKLKQMGIVAQVAQDARKADVIKLMKGKPMFIPPRVSKRSAKPGKAK